MSLADSNDIVASEPRGGPAVDNVINAFPEVVKEAKEGWKTTEFWMTIIAGVLVNVDAVPLPDKFQGFVTIALAVGYALSRGVAKSGVPVVEPVPVAVRPDAVD